jgi:hypothetical protein
LLHAVIVSANDCLLLVVIGFIEVDRNGLCLQASDQAHFFTCLLPMEGFPFEAPDRSSICSFILEVGANARTING